MKNQRWIIPALFCLLIVVSPCVAEEPAAINDTHASNRHALLIGCTSYPLLDVQSLEGSANDVVLMQTLLTRRFGFLPTRIVTLSEEQGAQKSSRRPTRENIQTAFAKLAETVHHGDQVVILMSGHGTQIPAANSTDLNNFEPDGFEEVFLCADAKPYDTQTNTLSGGIVDNELGHWVRSIRDRGARIWMIVDCCHSGTIVRGPGDEVLRRVPSEKVVPRQLVEAARSKAKAKVRTRGEAATNVDVTPLEGDLKNIVSLYAAQPEESTIELPLPRDADVPKKYGLLTYTLCEVLMQAGGRLTYRELTQCVQGEYVRSGRTSPTPFLEGGDRDREVLGFTEWPHRSAIRISAVTPSLQINAGRLHGLTQGTVLSVNSLDGKEPQTLLGYVQIVELGEVVSSVKPVEYNQVAAASQLPLGSHCELAFVDYGLQKLRIHLSTDAAHREKLDSLLAEVAKRSGLLQNVTDRDAAEWIVRTANNQVLLEPSTGIDTADQSTTSRFGPVALDDHLMEWLGQTLGRIARAKNLLTMPREALASHPANPVCQVQLELLRLTDKRATQGEPVVWQSTGISFRPGEIIGCRLTNVGEKPVDVTLLFVDAGYGITAVFPRPGIKTDNRLYPGDKPVMAFRAQVDDTTSGLEHLVMIAVSGEGDPLDFSLLDQPTLPQLRGDAPAMRGLHSPLGELLQNALFAKGGRRGGSVGEFSNQQLARITWRVVLQEMKSQK